MYLERMDNIYVIDTKMFGFDHYMSAYLVAGKEVALIDTGVPSSLEVVREAIKKHGFALSDISYIFVTHCEHPDHSGNVAKLLKESPKANVYINPVGQESLTDPSIADAQRKKWSPFYTRWEGMEPTPHTRIRYLHDGEVFDLGNGEVLEVIFTPGHQPSGITLFEQKNRGLFINDLIGNYFLDADSHAILTSMGSDIKQSMESLRKLMGLQITNLYLGHFGIVSENAKQVMAQTLNKMQQVLDIGATCMKQNKPDMIGSELNEFFTPYIEKMRQVRGEEVYQYIIQEHLPFLIKGFTNYCQSKLMQY